MSNCCSPLIQTNWRNHNKIVVWLLRHCHHRIDFKLAKLAFLARSSATSSYLNSSVARYLPSRTLRSQDTCLLDVPRTKTVFGSRAFRVAAPTVFNSLPQAIRSTDKIFTFMILSPFKDNSFPQCLRATLATLRAPQIKHIWLTLRA